MLGPYTANNDGTISYKGNKIFRPIDDIICPLPVKKIENRVKDLNINGMWKHLTRINHTINLATNKFFDDINALFVPLPLVTKMISSPGAIYGKERIDYITDTCPINVQWFNEKTAFLAESSQIYLEISLIQDQVNQVYSIYNSFRKEESDITHLSEFHHIEYEGKVTQRENEDIALGLIQKIIKELLTKNKEDLTFFLSEERLNDLKRFSNNIFNIPRITFREALNLLYHETKDKKYQEFTSKHFGIWEEIKLTEILRNMVIIKEYPLLEVPFYHAEVDEKNPKVANNADIIWPSYVETVGTGHRVRTEKELEEKATIFNLPKKDYEPYLQTRRLENYEQTSGFGLGWERLLQGLLELPFIWSGCAFPRVDKTLVP